MSPQMQRLAALCGFADTQAIRASISPATRPRHPTSDEIAAQRDTATPRPFTARAQRPAVQWFAELEEHFPRAYLHAFASDFDQLREVSGCTPREAAAFAFAYWQAPRIAL